MRLCAHTNGCGWKIWKWGAAEEAVAKTLYRKMENACFVHVNGTEHGACMWHIHRHVQRSTEEVIEKQQQQPSRKGNKRHSRKTKTIESSCWSHSITRKEKKNNETKGKTLSLLFFSACVSVCLYSSVCVRVDSQLSIEYGLKLHFFHVCRHSLALHYFVSLCRSNHVE